MITQSFDLNLIPEQEPVVVHCDQYDTGEGRLVATLYDGDMVYTPSGTAAIQGTKPDGHGFSYSATISGSTVSADLTEQMSIAYGDVRCQFVITETDGRTGTFVFILRVQKSALPDNSDMSESEYSAIEEAVNACNQAVSDAQGYAEDSEESAEDSEAWAVGQRNGVDVPSTDPTYHNNSKYWASQANVTSLGALSDVTLSSPTNGEALVYDGEKWVNGAGGIAKYNRSEANVLGAKNLLDVSRTVGMDSNAIITLSETGFKVENTTAGTYKASKTPLDLEIGSTYTVTFDVVSYSNTGNRVSVRDTSNVIKAYVDITGTGTFSFDFTYQDGFYLSAFATLGTSTTGYLEIENVMLRLASDPDSTYEPYAMTNRQLTEELADKQDTLTFDSTPTSASTNPVTSGGVYTALSGKLSGKLFGTTTTSNGTTVSFSDIDTTKAYMLMADYASGYNGALVGISNTQINGTTITYTVTNASVNQTFALFELN